MDLIKLSEVSRMLGCSRSSLYDLIGRRRIPFFRLPGAGLRFDRSEVEAWAGEHHRDPETAAGKRAGARS